MEYTTKETLKAYLGITSTDFDTQITALIKRCTQQFDKYLGRNLWAKDYTEYFVVDGDNIIIVANGPIKTIANIKFDNASWSSISYTRFDGNIVYFPEELDGTVYIEYNAWYTALTDILDVEQACLEVCKDLWDNTPASGNEANIKSKQIETLSKTYFSKDEMAWGIWVSFRETLDNYKTFNPLIV